ncbi:hypothetical protein ACA910_004177 [Epithemia clementina (nom. ined.)]
MTSIIRERSKTWSPIDCLPGAKLTESGLLEMLPGEVLMWNRPDLVELRAAVADEAMTALSFGGNPANTTGKTWVDRSLDCQLTITTHRIVFQQQLQEPQVSSNNHNIKARFIHLSSLIADTQLERGTMFKTARILLGTAMGELYVIFRGEKGNGNAKDVVSSIETAVRRQEWETESKLQKMEKTVTLMMSSSNKVGVDAILSRSAARHEHAASITSQAFAGDAETLMEEAAALIKIIEKYVSTLDHHDNSKSSSSSNSDGDSSAEDNKRLTDMLQNMGMTAALRKTDYKGREEAYYAQLARQLADFLRPKLKNTMMTLTDVYCLYNRARGSNLISPDDLLQAVQQMEQIKTLGLSHYTFPSGLRVLQDAALNQDQMAQRLVEIASSSSSSPNASGLGGTTEVETSRHLQVSVVLAREQLLAAESKGYLVRDETTESIRFFPNRFDDWYDSLIQNRRSSR